MGSALAGSDLMKDITSQAMGVLMKHAPVWAASMAGRTKVFISDETPTAHVTGSNGRFKIVINPKLKRDMPFILMHEVAHIFRADIISMKNNQHLAREINVAADCIINDSLKKMKIPITTSTSEMVCWGKDIYEMDCSTKSINDLMKITPNKKQMQKAQPSEPGKVTSDGEPVNGEAAAGEGGESEKDGKRGGGVGDDFSGYIGLGGGQVHGDPKQLARSVVAYARRMFFEKGFKSKNMSTKYDWRRNRSAFASRQDIVIPRTTVGEYGHNTEGPLVNLVLDTSGSMDASWVATAAVIAREVGKAGLDYDLWLTPSTQKAKNPEKVLEALINGGAIQDHLEEPTRYQEGGPRPSRNKEIKRIGVGANELREIINFKTEDPVVWIYVGDYKSDMRYELFLDANFLHIPMLGHEGLAGDAWSKPIFEEMHKRSLPRWFYKT